MKRIYRDKRTTVYHGDAAKLDKLADASIDAIVCDPPYELGFMGKGWDASGVAYDADMWRGCLRVLKPGGYLVAFGGTRTWHRLACAIEDAGFEIRDSIAWMYGSGFPKSHNVSKAIGKAAGATREVVGPGAYAGRGRRVDNSVYAQATPSTAEVVTAPATDAARRWDGWGTALKPGHEPIILARKPLAGTVAANVLAHGTGGLNIDGCRVESGSIASAGGTRRSGGIMGASTPLGGWTPTHAGRWPTNVVLSHVPTLDEHGEPDGDACADGCVVGCPVAELDGQSGTGKSSKRTGKRTGTYGEFAGQESVTMGHNDSGGASRFFPTFRYQAKAPTKERVKVDGAAHPTVKPLALMRWLVRLVTPPGGTVLDPFAGSGTTVEAARLEGFRAIAVEREPSYLPLIEARIERSAA